MKLILIMVILTLVQSLSASTLKIKGNLFYLDEKPIKLWGIRVASASQNEKNTAELIAALDEYKGFGIECISVFLQGSSGGYSDPFSSDGNSIDPDHWNRLERIIRECDKRELTVIIGVFYQRAMSDKEKSRKLKGSQAVTDAISLVTRKLKPYRNIILNIANEQNSSLYRECSLYDFNNPENIIALCREVHSIDPERITGGGGYQDDSNIRIGKSPDVDVLLFDTWSKDIEENKDSGCKYDYYCSQGVTGKPMINVEIFGGWTQKFVPQGIYPEDGKKIHLREIEAAKARAGLNVHFHSNPWFQGPSIGLKARYDPGGIGTAESPGIRWWLMEIKKN